MTIKYTLTRAEIVRVFLVGLGRSPRILTVVLILASIPASVSLITAGVLSQGFNFRNVMTGLIWLIIGFCSVVGIVFARAKTEERTLSVSQSGISTQIGSIRGERPWSKVQEIKISGSYILIVGTTGNSFFIPARAFSGSNQRDEFVSEVKNWHGSV
jgi:hypothetical protein